MSRKISIKLALVFISILIISSIISFIVSSIVSPSYINEMRDNQREIAETILELNEKTDLTLEEILNAVRPSLYNLQIEDLDSIDLQNDSDMKKLLDGNFIENQSFRLRKNYLIFQVNNSAIRIGVASSQIVPFHMIARLWDSFLLYILIGTLIIIVLVRRVVKPVVNVTNATQEVAKGNFNIELDTNSNDEIGQLTKNFNKMVKELRNIEILRKDFISNVSHEFKTPLASIQGFAKVLLDEKISNDERQEYLCIIIEETSRLSNLSSNLLKLSKIESQGIIEAQDEFYLDEQIRKAILMLAPNWEKKDIEFDIKMEEALYQGNEELMNQVWINIIANAINFSHQGGKIEVVIDEYEFNYLVHIIDYGIGMDEETKKRAFEQFYQGEKSHSNEGSGLGLTLAHKIIEIHGGSITIESVEDVKTIVTVNLLKER